MPEKDQYCRLAAASRRLRSHVFFSRIWNHDHHSHPNISNERINGSSDSLNNLLQAGKINLYIGNDVPVTPDRQCIELTREKLHCCFSRSLTERCHPDDWQDRLEQICCGVRMQDIIDLPLITVRKGNRLRNALDAICAHELNPHYIFESNQQELIYGLARWGGGSAFSHRLYCTCTWRRRSHKRYILSMYSHWRAA